MTNTEKKPLVSIICPAYNAEATIKETILSLVNQTYNNIEIVIVDDGSLDDTEAICKGLAEGDLRIKLYRIENHGVSYARNYALQQAKGEYIAFVDSDDLIKSIAIEKMVNAAFSYDKKLVTSRYWNGAKHSIIEFQNYKTNNDPTIEIIDFNKFRFTNKYTHPVVWGALYHKDLLKDLHFRSDLFIGEDTYFFAEALFKAREIAFIDDVYYYYTILDTSLAHSKYNKKQITEITAWEDICELFSHENKDFLNECRAQMCWTCIRNYERATLSGYEEKEDIKQIYVKAEENSKYLMMSKELPNKKKAYTFLFLRFPKMVTKLELRRFFK